MWKFRAINANLRFTRKSSKAKNMFSAVPNALNGTKKRKEASELYFADFLGSKFSKASSCCISSDRICSIKWKVLRSFS